MFNKDDVKKPDTENKKPNPPSKGDLDEFIFKGEVPKIHSER